MAVKKTYKASDVKLTIGGKTITPVDVVEVTINVSKDSHFEEYVKKNSWTYIKGQHPTMKPGSKLRELLAKTYLDGAIEGRRVSKTEGAGEVVDYLKNASLEFVENDGSLRRLKTDYMIDELEERFLTQRGSFRCTLTEVGKLSGIKNARD